MGNDEDWLKSTINRIEQKVDVLDQKMDITHDKINNLDVTTVKQGSDLEHHIYRTELAEENIALLREQIQPLESHVRMIQGALKLLGFISVAVSIAAGVIKLVDFFKS